MIFEQLHFIRPWWFIALVPLILLLWLLARNIVKRNNWSATCDAHLLPFLLSGRQQKKHYGPLLCLMIIWFIMVFSLAGPSWKKMQVPTFQNQQANIILFDLSYKMDANDIPPTRLVHARYKLIDLLKKAKDGRFGLIAYAGETYVVTPLTEDANTIEALVPQLSPDIMPVDGNDLPAAYQQAKQLFQQADAKTGNIFVVTANDASPQAIKMAQQMAQQGYKSYVLGIGTPKGAPILLPNGSYLQDNNGAIMIAKLNIQSLKQLAQAGGGTFQSFTSNNQDVANLLASAQDLKQAQLNKHQTETITRWQDEGRWFLLLILPLLLLTFRRGWFTELLP